MVCMASGAGRVPVRLPVVHRSGALRLKKGFDCAEPEEVAHKSHSTERTADGAGSTKKSKDLGVSGGSTGRSRETLDGFFFDSHRSDSPFVIRLAVA
jgi:hypothetical protein